MAIAVAMLILNPTKTSFRFKNEFQKLRHFGSALKEKGYFQGQNFIPAFPFDFRTWGQAPILAVVNGRPKWGKTSKTKHGEGRTGG